MEKLTAVLLLMMLAAATSMVATAGASIPGLQAKRSRFQLANSKAITRPCLRTDCSKKSDAVCLAPGSPGPTCCGGQCVDMVASTDHCGDCYKVYKHGHVCCGGRCVDLLSDNYNCSKCSNQCNKKCSYGFCGYAQ